MSYNLNCKEVSSRLTSSPAESLLSLKGKTTLPKLLQAVASAIKSVKGAKSGLAFSTSKTASLDAIKKLLAAIS